MSEEDLDEAVSGAVTDLANAHINGGVGEVVSDVTHKADVENNGNNGVSANEPAVNQETPPKEQDQQQDHDIEENGKTDQIAGKREIRN